VAKVAGLEWQHPTLQADREAAELLRLIKMAPMARQTLAAAAAAAAHSLLVAQMFSAAAAPAAPV
jgi:hypothetical protein